MRAILICVIEFPFFRRKPAFEALIYKGFLGVGFVIPIPRKGTETFAACIVFPLPLSFVIPIPRKGTETISSSAFCATMDVCDTYSPQGDGNGLGKFRSYLKTTVCDTYSPQGDGNIRCHIYSFSYVFVIPIPRKGTET